MLNICQAQMKGKQDNETDKRIKREQEKGPRCASRSKGSKASSLRVRRFEVSWTQRFKDFEDSSKASKTLRWLPEGFPLTITPPQKSINSMQVVWRVDGMGWYQRLVHGFVEVCQDVSYRTQPPCLEHYWGGPNIPKCCVRPHSPPTWPGTVFFARDGVIRC